MLFIAKFAPLIFIFLWSTGFIGAKYALPYIEPYTLLFIRFIVALAVLFFLFIKYRPFLLVGWRTAGHLMASGLLVHGAYLGGVFSAIKLGMPAGVCALLVGLQPILTAAVSPFVFNKAIPRLHWFAILLGFLGIYVVLGNRVSMEGFGLDAVLFGIIALLGITFGTIYQKRITANVSIFTVAFYQYGATVILFACLSLAYETQSIHWSGELIVALLWLVFALSIGAILLLNFLIKQHESHRVSSLFYLVPPLTAIEALVLFNEQLTALNLLGMLIVVISVYLIMRK